MLRPSTLTPSKLSAFTTCALAFRFAVIERLPEVPSPYALKGTLVHRALQLLFSNQSGTGRTPDAAEAALAQAWEELGSGPELDALELSEDGRTAFLADAAKLLGYYFEIEDPTKVQAIGLELGVRTEVAGLVLRGIIDRLDLLPNGELAIVDYKTGRAPSLEHSRSRLAGVEFYAFLCEELLGRRPAEVRLLYLRDRIVITEEPTDLVIRGVRRRALAVWDAIDRACTTGDFRPSPSGLCRTCSFQPFCPAFGGDPGLAATQLAPTQLVPVQLASA